MSAVTPRATAAESAARTTLRDVTLESVKLAMTPPDAFDEL